MDLICNYYGNNKTDVPFKWKMIVIAIIKKRYSVCTTTIIEGPNYCDGKKCYYNLSTINIANVGIIVVIIKLL